MVKVSGLLLLLSYLLFEISHQYLLDASIDQNHIIKIALDDKKMYYILLDEVQLVSEFEDVLNGFFHIKNADTYMIGSNARLK